MCKNRKFLAIVITFLTVTTSVIPAKAVTVGSGSYTETMPSGFVGPQSNIYKTENITGAANTNDWNSSVLWEKYSETLYAHPLSYKCTGDGLEVSKPFKSVFVEPDGEKSILMEHKKDFTVGAATFNPTEARADKNTDWSIDILMPNGSNSIKTTITHGSPYAYFEYSGSNPKITFPSVPEVFSGNTGTQYLGITINGNSYGLFAPSGSTWSGIGTNTLTCNLKVGTDYFSVAILPNTDALSYFKDRAYAFISDTKVSWAYDEINSTVTTTFNVITEVKEGTNTDTVLALYPHQWRDNNLNYLSYTYSSIRGTMKTVSGTSFTTNYKYTGILPWLPDSSLNDSNIKSKVQSYVDEYESYGASLSPKYISAGLDSQYSGYDTYWMGKNLGRLSNIIPIANQIGDTDASSAFMTSMKDALEWWFKADKYDASGNLVNDNLFYYDKNWGTLIGHHPGYGTNTSLNDHHFHYGYWINAAASVVLNGSDSDWGLDSKWGGMVKELIDDIANIDRTNLRYPFLRNFDPYVGHSWASGDCNFASTAGDTWHDFSNSGNNQESSSESINAWAGLILWGEATGNKQIRDAGIYLYTTEVRAINNYWFDIYGDIHDSEFVNTDAVMMWGGRYTHGTWWTENPTEAHGINMLPITGASFYLGENPEYVKKNYNATYSEWSNYMTAYAKNGWNTNKDVDLWQDVLCSYLALGNPEEAISKWKDSVIPEFGETKAHTYHWMQTFNTLGLPDFTVTCDTPLYSVFMKDGKRAYVAYNASESSKTVTFSDGKTLYVGAKSMATATGNSNGITPTPTTVPKTPTPTAILNTVTPTPTALPYTPTPTTTPSGVPSITPTPTGDFTNGVDYVGTSQANVWFLPKYSCSYVILHYKIDQGPQQNVFMTLNNSKWELALNGLSEGSTVDYSFTYISEGSSQQDSTWLKYTHTQQGNCIYGDVSNDGKVDSADYLLLRKYLLGIVNKLPNPNWKVAGDLNEDGKVDPGDYLILKRYLLRIIVKLPF